MKNPKQNAQKETPSDAQLVSRFNAHLRQQVGDDVLIVRELNAEETPIIRGQNGDANSEELE